MKNRFLTATAALSVALAAMQPLPLLAQDAATPDNLNCTPGEGDCPPEASAAPQAQPESELVPEADGGETQPEAAPAAEAEEPQPEAAPAEEAPVVEPDAAPAEGAAEPGSDAPEPAAEAGDEAPAEPITPDVEAPAAAPAVEDAPRADDAAAPDSVPAEEPVVDPNTEGSADAEVQGEAEADTPAAPAAPAATQGSDTEEAAPAATADDPEAEAPQADPATPDAAPEDGEPNAGSEAAGESDTAQPEATPDATPEAAETDCPAAPDTSPAEAEADAQTDEAQPQDDAATEDVPAATGSTDADPQVETAAEPQETQPSERAVETLGTLLTGGDDGRPTAVEADVEGEADSGRVIERRVTERDSRSSAEEFSNQVNESGSDDDDDDGLSDLQKFGLLALGGLAVGALLNNGDEVVSNSGDRVVVQQSDGTYSVLKDDDTLIRRPGSDVQTRTYDDGSTRTLVTREDGSQIVTIRDASGRVLRRTRINADGQEVYLINDLNEYQQVDVSQLPEPRPEMRLSTRDGSLREALDRLERQETDRSFSLRQIRDYREVRNLAPSIDIEGISFNTGSAAIGEGEAAKLADLGNAIADLIAERPSEIVLIEGHTDAVGSAASNLALSDRRAESVALALTEYFNVPPENLVVQGYGESDLVVDTEGESRENRRATARIITPLLEQAAAN